MTAPIVMELDQTKKETAKRHLLLITVGVLGALVLLSIISSL